MPSFTNLAAATTVVLASTSYAMPEPTRVQPRQAEDTLAPWVTVGDDGKPATVTPVLSTVDGTPTVISGAPHDLTATVYTTTSLAEIFTNTGEPPLPTATNTKGSGSFSVCDNMDGDMAPWCLPSDHDTLYVGTTYYFTWDPDYFNTTGKNSNATVQIIGNWINETTGDASENAFHTEVLAAWGFWQLNIKSDLLRYQGGQNISVDLFGLMDGKKIARPGPTIFVTNRPGYAPSTGGKPSAFKLAIALPLTLAFVIFVVVGTFIWNRKHRRIELGNVMARGKRHGRGLGGGKRNPFSRSGKKSKQNADQRIQLMEREIHAEGGEMYRDLPDPATRPRRDSDDLGSLTGTPTEERQMRLGGDGPTGNAFRDELRRQDGERR